MEKNTAELLQQMIDIKRDMRTAIGNKGVTVVSGMESYPSAIESIQQEISGGVKLPDGTKFSWSTFTSAPFFDTSQYTDMSFMFDNCRNLQIVPQFDTSNVTNMDYMFRNCTSLANIPYFNTSNVTSMLDMFNRYYYSVGGTGVAIERIPLMDCGNVEFFQIFGTPGDAGKLTVKYIEGFKDLGKSITKDYIAASNYKNVSFTHAYLTNDSKVNIINNLYNIASQNKTLTLQMNVAGLSDDDIAIATNKGWIIQ
jgi:surface protein